MDRLTKAEEEVMLIIWKKGACTVSDIIATLPQPKPAHSTISSFVRILEKKGYVDHKAYGRTYEYFPIIDRKAYSKNKVSGLLSDFFEGSVDQLVSFLVKEDQMSIQDMQELLDKIKKDEE